MRVSKADARKLGVKVSSQSKYRNRKTTVGGIVFDSKREAGRYQELKLLERAGEISGITTQPEFNLSVCGYDICKYRGDFAYWAKVGDAWSKYVVEDVKGFKTPVYRLKKKLMKAIYGIDVVEV